MAGRRRGKQQYCLLLSEVRGKWRRAPGSLESHLEVNESVDKYLCHSKAAATRVASDSWQAKQAKQASILLDARLVP